MARLQAGAAAAVMGTASAALAKTEPAGAWTPKFFAPEQCELLAAVGERILPGSAAAHCDRVIDLVMSVETADIREQLVHALAAFDSLAQAQFGHPFRELATAQQDGVVAAESERTGTDDPFAVVKEWVVDAYWSSRDGMRELGWNGQMAWTTYPGCGMTPGS